MAEIWVRTRWKKFLLNALDLGARFARQFSGGDADRNGPLAAADVRRILVIELWNIGDIILTLPFLAQLRRIFPEARVTLLARPHAREILEGTGLVDDFIVADLGWTEKTISGNALGYSWRELFRVVGRLRERRFDLAFQARTHVREHFLLGTSLAKRRVGLAMGSDGGVLTDAIHHLTGSHKTDDWLSLLAPFGGAIDCGDQRLSLSAVEREWATEYLRGRGVEPHHTLIGLHPGASVPKKRWPLARFEEVLRSLFESP
ncbi:MAG: glycosyltransferase family 9 protein, partial [Gemmatimonadaceae bacterium]|nr:glycosyltransferase family 9 protein [Gemmatimonadaceae bacterium]